MSIKMIIETSREYFKRPFTMFWFCRKLYTLCVTHGHDFTKTTYSADRNSIWIKRWILKFHNCLGKLAQIATKRWPFGNKRLPHALGQGICSCVTEAARGVLFRSFVFMWRNHFPKLNVTLPSEVLVSSDERPYRNLTFHNVLAQQGSSYCNRAHLHFQAFALRDMTMAAWELAVAEVKRRVITLVFAN